jgi:hypothetical protein
MGECVYEESADARVIAYLTSPHIVALKRVTEQWSVTSLLKCIATSTNPPFHALIDTGALITGMSNVQVAHYLLQV